MKSKFPRSALTSNNADLVYRRGVMLSLLNTWQTEGCQEEFTLELVHTGSRPVQRSKAYREQEPF